MSGKMSGKKYFTSTGSFLTSQPGGEDNGK
jgi:hypothetical protein